MSNIKEIEYFVGNSQSFDKESNFTFDGVVCDFLNCFAEELNKNKHSKNFSDLKSLAFWCRKRNIENIKRKHFSKDNRLGLGLLFHITPSNVPTNFAYSLIFGLITGNSNIVKLPSKNFDQIKIICNVLKLVLKKKKYSELKKKITIIRYKENDEATKYFSSICDARLIWGGDKSINSIRNFKIKERSLDISFADRYSLAAIDVKEINKLNNHELEQLARKFYNDTYAFDQNACSSPRLVIWIGDNIKNSKEKFWNNLHKLIKQKYNMPKIAISDKYTKFCSDILNLKNIKSYKKYENSIYTINLKKLDPDHKKMESKWGYFYEYECISLNKIPNIFNNRYQTLTYFGFSKENIKDFIMQNKLAGIDRAVPIGQAMEMSLYWDGYDIHKILSRTIEVK